MLWDWFNSLTALEQVLLVIGIPAATLYLLQLVLRMVVGFEHDISFGSLDSDHDTGGLVAEHSGFFSQSFSPMNISIFLSTLCLAGFGFIQSAWPAVIALLLSAVLGVVGIIGNIFIWRILYTQTEDNTPTVREAVGRRGSVYATIPASMAGAGQVTVEISGAFRQVDAFTESELPLKTGENVTILRSYRNGSVLVGKQDFQF